MEKVSIKEKKEQQESTIKTKEDWKFQSSFQFLRELGYKKEIFVLNQPYESKIKKYIQLEQ